MFVITDRTFYDEFTGTGGAGVKYLNALQGDKITCVIQGYFFWATENANVNFDSGTKTISLFGLSKGTTYSFIRNGFTVGDSFVIVGSPSNNGTYTIAAVTDTVITTVEALITENGPSSSFYGTTRISDIDLLYDLISTNSQKSDFVSATDIGTVQKYSATGLNASVATPVSMSIATQSRAWVTDVLSGNYGEAIVEGAGIANHRQSFKITHVFYMTRMWTAELMNNFMNRTAPDEYKNGSCLKHVFRIDGKFNKYDPIVPHTGSVMDQKAATGWFNQSNTQGKQEYTIGSVQYQNNATSEYLYQLEGSIVNKVTIMINSASGKFVANTSKFIVNHFLCPSDQAAYIGTDTTLLQNIRLDKKMVTSDQAAVNGIGYGGNYQALKDITIVNFSAYQVVITFLIDYSAATKAILKSKAVTDRYYAFVISCQDIAITTTKNIDRVNVIADFNIADYDVREKDIFGLIDYFHSSTFPNARMFETNTIKGRQGDPGYIEIPFWVETAAVNNITPTLQTLSLQIVSTKADNDDFIIEEKIFDVSQIRKLNDIQTINVQDVRGFIYPEGSPWNMASVIRDPQNDSGTKIAYKILYGFVFRYEEWIQVVQAASGNSYAIFKDIENVVQAWKRYSTGFGWVLNMRLNAVMQGYSGLITNYTAKQQMTVLDDSDLPQGGPTLKVKMFYFTMDGVNVDGVMKYEPTRIVAKFYGEVGVMPAGMNVFVAFMSIADEFGNIFTRRICTTEFNSESDSPFSTADLPILQNVLSEEKSDNLRLSKFTNRVEVDTIYTPDLNVDQGTKNIQVRMSYTPNHILLQQNGYPVNQQNNQNILITI